MSRRINPAFRSFALVVALASVQPCLAQVLVTSASVRKDQARTESQHKRKVWTNEDLTALRKSSDVLLDQEISRKQSEQAAAVQPPAGDTAKHTLLPAETPKSVEEADRFIASCRKTFGLEISGLMCIPPLDQEPSPHFALLREIARRHDLTELSMGMSADFEIAIRLGATHVRVGTAIFGERPRPVGA